MKDFKLADSTDYDLDTVRIVVRRSHRGGLLQARCIELADDQLEVRLQEVPGTHSGSS